MPKVRILVVLDRPGTATLDQVTDYVREAVRLHCNELSPLDPMAQLNRKTITARPTKDTLP